MKLLFRSSYQYGFIDQSPVHRITSNKIISNVKSQQISLQLINNLQIAFNCTKIAMKYSKCYLCRVPAIRYPLRHLYQMKKYDDILDKVQQQFQQQCPVPKYKGIFKRFDYQNKAIYAAFSLLDFQEPTAEQEKTAIKFLTALELVNLGFSLHHSVGKSHKLNLATRVALKLMSKQMKDSYLVLGGDYFHIKGSVLASQTQNVKLSQLLSDVEIDLCKYVHLNQQLKNKILQSGYHTVDIKQIYNISILKTSPIVKGLRAINIIVGKDTQKQKMKQIYEIIGLLLLYRKDLQNFMFNFKAIVKKYLEYKANRINFDSQESLPYYIFFQGAQNQRIDTSYLNTVTMMSEQIEYLQNRIKVLIGQKNTEQLLKKMNYYLMIYS